MGCIFSTEAVDDVGGPTLVDIPVQSGEIHVFVPGFREPKQIDLTELLKGSVSAGMASKLHSLRSQIIAASGSRKVPVMKLSRRKSLDGKDISCLLHSLKQPEFILLWHSWHSATLYLLFVTKWRKWLVSTCRWFQWAGFGQGFEWLFTCIIGPCHRRYYISVS